MCNVLNHIEVPDGTPRNGHGILTSRATLLHSTRVAGTILVWENYLSTNTEPPNTVSRCRPRILQRGQTHASTSHLPKCLTIARDLFYAVMGLGMTRKVLALFSSQSSNVHAQKYSRWPRQQRQPPFQCLCPQMLLRYVPNYLLPCRCRDRGLPDGQDHWGHAW